MYRFTQLSDASMFPPEFRARLSVMFSDIIEYVMTHFDATSRYKKQVVDLLNTVAYSVISGDALPRDWDPKNPFVGIVMVDTELCSEVLKTQYFKVTNILWDIDNIDAVVSGEESMATASDASTVSVESAEAFTEIKMPRDVSEELAALTRAHETAHASDATHSDSNELDESAGIPYQFEPVEHPTPKEHLYLRLPSIPQFDVNRVVVSYTANNIKYVIYKSLPEVPTNQSQISVTTDIDMMTDSDLLGLFPNTFIRTRAATLYQMYEGLPYDPDLGVIFPISGFTLSQVRDNIIKYPHIYKMYRVAGDNVLNFYSRIEVDGELLDTLSYWNAYMVDSGLPRQVDFIKEYVVRRYLLERDVAGVDHKYPIFGSFDPFLTLFTTADHYSSFGYDDPVAIARTCVKARVAYKRSRNPIWKAAYHDVMHF